MGSMEAGEPREPHEMDIVIVGVEWNGLTLIPTQIRAVEALGKVLGVAPKEIARRAAERMPYGPITQERHDQTQAALARQAVLLESLRKSDTQSA